MRKLLIFLALLLAASPAWGANHYCTPAGAGTNSGDDFSNAYVGLPTTLTRGDKYWLASGSYGDYDFDDNADGTKLITISFVDADSCGAVAGWNAAFDDSCALFTDWDFSKTYYSFDGRHGTLDTSGSFGLKVHKQAEDSYAVYFANGTENITMSYVEVRNWGYTSTNATTEGSDGLIMSYGSDNCTFTHCWFHNSSRCHVHITGGVGNVWDSCWFTELYGDDTEGIHGEIFSITGTPATTNYNEIKNCIMRNNEGSALIGFLAVGGAINCWRVYNNVFYNDPDHYLDGYVKLDEPGDDDYVPSNGVIASVNAATIKYVDIIGNTFAGINYTPMIAMATDADATVDSSRVYNNFGVDPVYDYTFAGDETGTNFATNDTSFVTAFLANNYTLAKATTTVGTYFATPFNVDILGTTRGVNDGAIDVGAYDFDATGGSVDEADAVTYHVNLSGHTAGGTVESPDSTFALAEARANLNDIIRHTGTRAGATITAPASGVQYLPEPAGGATVGGAKPLTGFTVPVAGGGEVLTDSTAVLVGQNDVDGTIPGTTATTFIANQTYNAVGVARRFVFLQFYPDWTNIDSTTTIKARIVNTVLRATQTIDYTIWAFKNKATPTDTTTFKAAVADTSAASKVHATLATPAEGVTYLLAEMSTIVNPLDLVAGDSLLVCIGDSPPNPANDYFRPASVENTTYPEASLYYTYQQTGAGGAVTFNYRALTGTEQTANRFWRNGTLGTLKADSTQCTTAGDYYIVDNRFYVADGDTASWTCDGWAANAVDTGGQTGVTVANVIIDGRGFSGHAVYMDSDSANIYNASIRSGVKGFHIRGNVPKLRNVAVDVSDTVFTVAGQDSFYMASAQAIPDSGMERVDTPWQMELWNEYEDSEYADAYAIYQDATYEHSGVRCAGMTASADNDSLFIYDSFTLLASQWYQLTFWLRVSAADDSAFYRIVEDDDSDRDLQTDGTWSASENQFFVAPATPLTWTKYTKIFKSADDTNFTIYLGLRNAPSDTLWFDDAKIKPVDLADNMAYDSDNVPTEFAGVVKVTSQDTLFASGYYPVDALVNMGAEVGLDKTGRYPDIGAIEDTLSIVLTAPNGGGSYVPGSALNITYNKSSAGIDSAFVEYSADSGDTWTTISPSENPDGSYPWTVPGISSTTVLVRVRDVFDATIADESNGVFTIGSASDDIWDDGTIARYGRSRPVSRYGTPTAAHRR